MICGVWWSVDRIQVVIQAQDLGICGDYDQVVVARHVTYAEEHVTGGHVKTRPKGEVDLGAGILQDILVTAYC